MLAQAQAFSRSAQPLASDGAHRHRRCRRHCVLAIREVLQIRRPPAALWPRYRRRKWRSVYCLALTRTW